MKRYALVLLVALLAAVTAFAQPVTLPRAKAPLTLLDMAKPSGLSGWSGLKVTAATLDGQPAMQFTFPKYVAGENEWPGVYLSYAGDKGYPTNDWSHYAILAFDVRSDSNQEEDLAVELRSTVHYNGMTSHLQIAPGKTNHVEFVLADLTRELQTNHVEQIVLFTTRPDHPYTITLGNVQLLPGQRSAAATFDLVYPNYRGLIFPEANRATVRVTTNLTEYDLKPEQLTLYLTYQTGRSKFSSSYKLRSLNRRVSLNTAEMPAGAAKLTAQVLGPQGEVLGTQTWDLRKLTAAEVRGLKVYVDQNNNTIVDGKPFFLLGWYGGGQVSQMLEIAGSPFNCLLDYGANKKPKAEMLKYLDEMRQHNLKLIYCLNDVYPAAKYYEGKTWEGVSGNQAIADAVVKAYRNHPTVLAWYLNDELPKRMVPDLIKYYQRVRDLDPNHPCYIVLCTMNELQYFPNTTDVMGVDPYPIPSRPVTVVSQWMDNANTAVNGHKPVWLVPQAFAWYQYSGADRGRVPTAEDLRTGRAPTYEEERCMTYLALAHGAKGLIYYSYYDMRVLPQYQEMWGWMKQIAAEVKELSPVLLSSKDLGAARFSPAAAPIHTKLKSYQGKDYLIAVNSGKEPYEVTFNLRHTLPPQVKVLFEKEASVTTAGNTFTAHFKPLEAHVYDLGPAARK